MADLLKLHGQLPEEVNADGTSKHLEHHPENNTLVITAGGYPYEIDLDEVETYMDILVWVRHLLGKTWMTADLMADLIDKIAEVKDLKEFQRETV
jgi:hypothetical protein